MKITKETKEDNEILNNIISKCWVDEGFKKRLLNNPVNTIEEFAEKKYSLPKNVTLKIVDQTDDKFVYLNIPRKLDLSELELTDEELEQVAGGWWQYVAMAAALYDFGKGFRDGMK